MSQPPIRRHLMDPDAPRPVRDSAQAERSLTRVQRWVMSALAVTTILHLSAGLIVAAVFIDDNTTAEIGLCLIAGAFAVIAMGVGLAIHQRNIVSPWLLLGTIPAAIGLLLVRFT